LEEAGADYSVNKVDGTAFAAEVRVAGKIGKAAGEPKARAISIALFSALGLEISGPASGGGHKDSRNGDHGK
jgi:hypothetical protein